MEREVMPDENRETLMRWVAFEVSDELAAWLRREGIRAPNDVTRWVDALKVLLANEGLSPGDVATLRERQAAYARRNERALAAENERRTVTWKGPTELQQDRRCEECGAGLLAGSQVIGGGENVKHDGGRSSRFIAKCLKHGDT